MFPLRKRIPCWSIKPMTTCTKVVTATPTAIIPSTTTSSFANVTTTRCYYRRRVSLNLEGVFFVEAPIIVLSKKSIHLQQQQQQHQNHCCLRSFSTIVNNNNKNQFYDFVTTKQRIHNVNNSLHVNIPRTTYHCCSSSNKILLQQTTNERQKQQQRTYSNTLKSRRYHHHQLQQQRYDPSTTTLNSLSKRQGEIGSGSNGGGDGGLFSLPELQHPSDFHIATQNSIRIGNILRHNVVLLTNHLISTTADSNTTTTTTQTTIIKDAKLLLRLLDGISQVVCNIVDAAELCRNVHTQPLWREAATESFNILSDYITQLNSDDTLYKALQIANELVRQQHQEQQQQQIEQQQHHHHSAVISKNDLEMDDSYVSDEEIRFGLLLQTEFERDGIHLQPEERTVVRNIQNQITTTESMFYQNLLSSQHLFTVSDIKSIENIIPRSVLQSFESSVRYTNQYQTLQLNNNDTLIMQTLLKYCPDPNIRKEVYMEHMTSVRENLEVIHELRSLRHELANQQLFESFAHRSLQSQLSGTPENVQFFLQQRMEQNKERYRNDMNKLLTIKQQHLQYQSTTSNHGDSTTTLHPWDVTFYSNIYKQHHIQNLDEKKSDELHDLDEGKTDIQTKLAEYFTLSNTIRSMQVLVHNLFGITMKEEVHLPKVEQWDINLDDNDNISSSIRKYTFTCSTKQNPMEDDEEEALGTMYLDLHPRAGKYGHAAHFTVRCGCVNNVITDLNEYTNNRNNNDDDAGDADASTSSTTQDKRNMIYQQPIVALVCNIIGTPPPPPTLADIMLNNNNTHSTITNNDELLLSHSEVETMFHEFGHALHSLLSRTRFQHVSGTRCSMDYVETPSNLFQNYVWDPYFLRTQLGKHYKTGESIPMIHIQTLLRSRNVLEAIEIQNQLLYSFFDQTLFGIPEKDLSSSSGIVDPIKIFAHYHDKLHIPYANGTHWFTRFGHLVSYGSTYYSYLYTNVFAEAIWAKYMIGNEKEKEFIMKQMENMNDDDNDRSELIMRPNHCMDRTTGEMIRYRMLIHGGAKDPKQIIRDVLHDRSPV